MVRSIADGDGAALHIEPAGEVHAVVRRGRLQEQQIPGPLLHDLQGIGGAVVISIAHIRIQN